MSVKYIKSMLGLGLVLSLASCRSLFFATDIIPSTVQVPYMKNSSNECYYLDDFMPTPDALITGRNGNLSLRYYSYKAATYKEWDNTKINLSFYSNDMRCWSLFEEFYTSH
ncbi:MAG: hypothetical protein WCO71_01500 [Pseudomonadota bacterium]